jgi:hypothetical protein
VFVCFATLLRLLACGVVVLLVSPFPLFLCFVSPRCGQVSMRVTPFSLRLSQPHCRLPVGWRQSVTGLIGNPCQVRAIKRSTAPMGNRLRFCGIVGARIRSHSFKMARLLLVLFRVWFGIVFFFCFFFFFFFFFLLAGFCFVVFFSF